MRALERAFDKIKEAFELVAQDEAEKMSSVQEIMLKSTDYLRRIIAPVGGQGGVTMSYLCPNCNTPHRARHQRYLHNILCGYFEHRRRVQFEGCAAEPLTTIAAILPGSKWSCLLLRIVLQDALSEVTTIYPPLKSRVYVDDITALVKRKDK